MYTTMVAGMTMVALLVAVLDFVVCFVVFVVCCCRLGTLFFQFSFTPT